MDINVLTNSGISAAFVALGYITYQLCSVVLTHPWRCRSHCCCGGDDGVIEFDEPTPPELRRPVLHDYFQNNSPSIF